MAGAHGNEIGWVQVRVVPDMKGFRAKVEKELKEIERLSATVDIKSRLEGLAEADAKLAKAARDRTATIEVDVRQGRDWAEELRGFARGLAGKAGMSSIPVDISVDEGRVSRSLAAVRARIEGALSNIKAKIGIEVNNTDVAKVAGGGMLAKLGSSISGAADAAMKGVSSFRAFGIGMAGLLAIVVLLAPALAVLTGSLLAIPGALAAITVPIGAIALGMDGIKKAAEAAGLFSDSNGDKKGGGGLGASLDAIKKKVSDTFENGLKPAFEGIKNLMANTDFQGAFSGVAQGLTDMFSGVVSSLTRNQGMITNTISKIGEGFSAAAPGVERFMDAVLTLANALAEKFPEMGASFSGVMKDFSEWATAFTTKDPSTGISQFDTAMQGLRTTVNAVLDLLKQIGLVSLDNLNSPGFGEGIKDFFKSVGDFVTNTLPGLQSGFEKIAGVMDTLSPVFRLFGLFKNGADILSDAFKAMGDGDFETPQKAIEAMNARMQESAKNGGSLIDQIIEGSTGFGDPSNNPFKNLPQQAGEAGKESVTAFTQSFNNLPVGAPITGADQILKPAVEAAKNTGTEAGAAFNEGIQAAPPPADPAWLGGGAMFSTIQADIKTNLDLALAPLLTIPEKVSLAFAGVAPAIVVGFQPALSAIQSLGTQMTQLLSSALGGNIYNTVASAFSGVAGAVTAGLGPAVQQVAAVATGMLQAMLAGLSAMNGVVQGSLSAVPAIVLAAMMPAVSSVASVCSQMISMALSMAGGMEQAGVAVGASFARGIASQVGTVAAAASALMAAARAFFPNSPADEGPFSGSGWVDQSGFAVGESFAKGIGDSTKIVVDAADSLMQQVKDMLNQPQSAETYQELLGLQSQMASLQMNGASAVDKAELQRMQDFNDLIQSRIKLRSNELNTAKKLNSIQVQGWTDAQKMSQETTKGVIEQAKVMQDSLQSSLEPLTTLTPDLLSGGGKSTIYEAGKVDSQTKSELEALKIKGDQIEMQRSLLALQQKSGDSPELKAQMALLDTQKQRLTLQSKELEYWAKYSDTSRDIQDRWEEAGAKLQDMPLDFAKATGQQFMQDLGMSGNGMIPQLLDKGSQYIFKVAGVDDALSAVARLQNKRSLGLVGR